MPEMADGAARQRVVYQQDDLLRTEYTARGSSKPGRRQLPNGKLAPQLMIEYRCETCGYEPILDAYAGVPSCAGETGPSEVRIEFDDMNRKREVWVAGGHTARIMRAVAMVGETR